MDDDARDAAVGSGARRRSPIAHPPVVGGDLPSKVLAIKEGETFLYSDLEGNVDVSRGLGLGLYHRDTRFLSHFTMVLSGHEPLLLSASAERAFVSHIDMTNPELHDDDRVVAPQHTLNIRRIRAIEDRLYERIRIKNYNPFPVEVDVELDFDADFADIFEVRGLARETRGTYLPPKANGRVVEFAYIGEDRIRRTTRIEFGIEPSRLRVEDEGAWATFSVRLGPHETKLVPLVVEPLLGQETHATPDFDATVHRLRRSYERWESECTQIKTDNEVFNQVLVRGIRDLRALQTTTSEGTVIAAGIPWYVAAFGRDTLITAHQLLMVNPRPARDSLGVLAALQGTKVDDWREEDPGKILHEIRRGELAGCGEIPHSPYYGSVDATPWFLIVFAQHFRWTNDLGFAKDMVPAAEAALAWIDNYGDQDGDGFVEYRPRSPKGLVHQGWKDSDEAVVHDDGTIPPPPIALAEVQAYVYMAKTRMAEVYAALGDQERAVRLREQAATLRRRFNEAFWIDDEQYFAFGLDGDKRQIRTVVSNPGHALYCGIVDPEKAEPLARRLLQPDLFSGWAIRTMSKAAGPYNPMSYHNGTVWPHDNALIAAGLKRYGHIDATNRVASALFDAATHADYLRLPELFCGFARRTPSPPVEYPVACSPQAWAAGAPFLLLQAMLGVSAIANENLLTINKPHLPHWLDWVELRGLRVGESRLSLVFRREGDVTGFSLLERQGDVRVVMEE